MTFSLFVGDVSDEVRLCAKNFNPNSELITQENLNSLSNESYYTSIADCGNIENFVQVCQKSKEIYYCPPVHWSDPDVDNKFSMKEQTERVLHYFRQFKDIHNFSKQTQPSWLQNNRVSEQQFWVVGCSITSAIGVKDTEKWPFFISTELNLPYTDLSAPGSSIIWQSDQICRSDIRPGEIVFWAVTGPHRLPIIDNNQLLHHMTISSFNIFKNDYVIKHCTPELLESNTIKWHNILAIRRAFNFCQKINAKLVPLGVLYDYDNTYVDYDIPIFRQLIQLGINQYVDLGTDGLHPGPLQHKLFAKEFLSHYRKIYC